MIELIMIFGIIVAIVLIIRATILNLLKDKIDVKGNWVLVKDFFASARRGYEITRERSKKRKMERARCRKRK